MKNRMFHLIILMLALCCALPMQAQGAAPARKKVRVGWYDSAFHRRDQFGRRSGYGYEYQQRVATYTGWEYEYVEGSWSELLEMLMAGEIDLLSDVSYTRERSEKILYSEQRMGSEDYHTFIAPDNTEIRPDDFSTFNGKRVGVNKSSIQAKLFREWADAHGVKPEIVELTAKTPEMLQMLDDGEIDVLVTLDVYGKTADVIPVCKVGFAESYFGVNKNRPDIKRELDVAMNRIMEDDRYYDQRLAEKYNSSDGFVSFLTPDEKEWYDTHGTIRVGYRTDYLPFCGLDEASGALTGALSDFLNFARTCEKNANLSFEARAFDTFDKALEALNAGEIDCIFPVSLTAYDGEQFNVIVTDPFVRTEMYVAVRNSDTQGVSGDRRMTVALIRGNPNFETFLMDQFPDWQSVYYDDVPSGFRAVGKGDVDCMLLSSYRLSSLNDLCAQYRLSPLATGESMDLAFAVRREDDCLYSILNKITRVMPGDILNSALASYSLINQRVTLAEFLRDNLSFVLTVAAVVVVIILLLILWSLRTRNRANRERQLITAVEMDTLTGLYNRNFFFEYANRIHQKNPEPRMDAIVLNIDHFHSINEVNGRDFGDQILKQLGQDIRAFLTDTEGIGSRFEADRFDIYCEPQRDYLGILHRFQANLDQFSQKASIQLRMGVTPWQKGVEPVLAFDRARTACNRMRGSERHLMIYDDEMQRRDQLNQRLLNDLGRGLAEGEFKVYYQPKYDIQGDEPVLRSAEALIRWEHPELGLISPGDFIPLFEKNGQISEIDRYVWREAARQIAQWRDRDGLVVSVSVNLSRVDTLDPALEDILDSLLREYGLSHELFNLEITESAYTDDSDRLCGIIDRLREKGYVIEMDDFGSGYSSLNMLSSMPIDILKMDMAFIRNIEHSKKDFRLVELILDIAGSLQVPVIAEGVETEKQLQMLKEAGCPIVQGYYFSRPLPAEEFKRKILKKDGL